MVSRSLAALLTAGALLLTSGCGSGTSPADDVPALAASLDRVDEAIAAEEYDAARGAVAELTDAATQAEAAGDLDAAETDRIVSAAEALLAALPGAEAPPAEPAPADAEGDGDDDEGDEGDGDDDEELASPPSEPSDNSGNEPKGPKGPKKPKGQKGKP